MQISAIDRIDPSISFDRLPISIAQRPSLSSAIWLILLSVPAVIALLVPFVLVAVVAPQHPRALAYVLSHPASLIQLGLACVVGGLIVGLPLRRLIQRLRKGQHVTIANGMVSVDERLLFGNKSWEAPLASYAGVADHIRASLSGTRHEIILVHPDVSKDVLLHLSDRPGPIKAALASQLLNLPELPAGDLYRRRWPLRSVEDGGPVMQAAA
jgi:hypothetical protein